jgi:DedD protein
MLLDKPEDALGPVGSNLPTWPDQSVADRIEPLTLPEPPVEEDPAQVVLDQPSADTAAAGDAALAEAVQQSDQTAAVTEPEAPAKEAASIPPATETVTEPPASAPATSQAPAPVAQPAPAATKVLSGWVVQLAALSKQDNALALRERLRTLGYTAFVEEIKTAKGMQYRVRVGPELERTNADNLRNRLEEQVKIKGIVMKYP